jgi:hypothetical protein
MDLTNIIPATLRDINEGKYPRECKIQNNNPFKIERGSDYEFVVRKIKIPVNSWLMPIDVNSRGYQINFQYEDKDIPFKDLVYGPNVRTIEGRIYSVQEFIDKLNALFTFYELGTFTLDRETELITFTSTTSAKWANIVVYMERKLCTLLSLHYEMEDNYEDARAVWLRFNYKFQLNDAVVVTQEEFCLDRFYKITGINVYTDLPTIAFVSDGANTIISQVLTNIDYNPQAMRKNNNVTLIPSNPLRYSLTNPGRLSGFKVWFTYVYGSSDEIALFLDVDEPAFFDGYFEKIEKIIL